MPELPEVETMRRGILGAVGGKVVLVENIRCPKKPITILPSVVNIRRSIVGSTISAIERIGKRVVVVLQDKDNPSQAANQRKLASKKYLIFEPRMTGLVLVANPPSAEHIRFRMKIGGGDVSEICFWDRRGLGSVQLLDHAKLQDKFGPGKIGADALSITTDNFFHQFHSSRREIKVALLDQKCVAGVGNIYASEMLHAAKINPQQKCSDLKRRQFNRLHHWMLSILNDAIEHEGSTLADGTYRNVLNRDGSYQNSHRVYDRESENCSSCNRSPVIRIVQSQRATFYCKRCQPLKSG